jgi:hypothetical protein
MRLNARNDDRIRLPHQLAFRMMGRTRQNCITEPQFRVQTAERFRTVNTELGQHRIRHGCQGRRRAERDHS